MVINQNHYIRLNLLQTIWQTCICVYISWKISITYFKAWFKLTLVCVHCLQLLPIVSLLFWLYNEASIFKILNLVADRFTAKAKLTGSQYEERQTVPLFHSHILCSLHLLYIDKIQKKFFFKMLVLKKKKTTLQVCLNDPNKLKKCQLVLFLVVELLHWAVTVMPSGYCSWIEYNYISDNFSTFCWT